MADQKPVVNIAVNFQQGDAVGWLLAWEVLGRERCEPLFPILGVPPGTVAHPRALSSLAQKIRTVYVAGLPGVPESSSDPGFQEAYDRAFASLLEQFFTQVAKRAGRREADSLYRWARRHFIDQDERTWWYRWYLVSSKLAASREIARVVPGLSKKARGWVGALAESKVGLTALEEASTVIAEAVAGQESGHQDRLSKSYDATYGRHDLGPTLTAVWMEERSREFWREISVGLSRAERQTLLDWGINEAAASGIPLPSHAPPA